MHTVIDIFNNLLKYGDKEICVIVDNHAVPWFSASNVAETLGYVRPNNPISSFVSDKNKTEFENLLEFIKNPPPYAKPNTIFMNESGLYELLINCRINSELAIDFKDWIANEVMPSIRTTGIYMVNEETRIELDKVNQKLKEHMKELKEVKKENEQLTKENEKIKQKNKEFNHKIRILKKNQKRKNYIPRGVMYIMRDPNSKSKAIKIGYTDNIGKKQDNVNNILADNVEVLFELEVKNPKAVEKCVKDISDNYIYRDGKEFYVSSVSTLKKIMVLCGRLIADPKKFIDNLQYNDSIMISIETKQIGQTGGNSDEEFINNEIIHILSLNNLSTVLMKIIVDCKEIYDDCLSNINIYVDRNNRIYNKSTIKELKFLMYNCNGCIDQVIGLVNKYNLKDSDQIVFYMPAYDQIGGKNVSNPEEYNKQINFLDGGGFMLPNGYTVLPTGKVIPPKK